MKKKVAFCESGYDIFYGAQQSLFVFLSNMDREKIDPVVVCPGKGRFTDSVSETGISIATVEQPAIFNQKGNVLVRKGVINKINTIVNYIRHVKGYIRYYKEENIELVYCNDIRSILTSGFAARLQGLPVIWYVRIDKNLGIFNWLAANIATEVITIANSLQSMFNKKLIYNSKNKFTTIYTGINLREVDAIIPDNRIRKELKVSNSTKLVALIGSIQHRKGQKDFVNVIKNIKEKNKLQVENTKFLIIGDLLNETHKSYLDEINEIITNNNLHDDVIFLGRRKDVIALIKQIDVVILPSYSEGLPRTILEAFSCSCPVIATSIAGAKEIITHKKNGLLVSPGAIEEISESILYMLEDRERTHRMGLNGRKCIEDNFVLENYINELENKIESL